MKYVGKSSGKLDNVYLSCTSTVCGPKELKGPLGKYMDKGYANIYCDEETWEKAEINLQKNAINILLKKSGLEINDISTIIGGDLNNQLVATNYAVRSFDIPFLGVYAACSTCTESLIIGSLLIDSGFGENVITVASSHNSTSERQFRYPTEYGGQKPTSTTSTVTGAGAAILSKNASSIKVTRFTVGKIVDANLSDTQDMGRAMAPAAAVTLKQHLDDFKINANEYDLILTGDLSKYGSIVFMDIMDDYKINLSNNYSDAGLMLYDLEKQEVFAGGSGCGCISLVALGYIIDCIKNGSLNKVLLIATGALMNPTMIAQGETIPCIAHAVCLERS